MQDWFCKLALVRTHYVTQELPNIAIEHFQNQNKDGQKKESGREKNAF